MQLAVRALFNLIPVLCVQYYASSCVCILQWYNASSFLERADRCDRKGPDEDHGPVVHYDRTKTNTVSSRSSTTPSLYGETLFIKAYLYDRPLRHRRGARLLACHADSVSVNLHPGVDLWTLLTSSARREQSRTTIRRVVHSICSNVRPTSKAAVEFIAQLRHALHTRNALDAFIARCSPAVAEMEGMGKLESMKLFSSGEAMFFGRYKMKVPHSVCGELCRAVNSVVICNTACERQLVRHST